MRRLVALAIVAVAFPASAAHAATVSVFVPPCSEEQSKYDQCYPDEARYVAGPGEQNTVTIGSSRDPITNSWVATLHDDGAPLHAGPGCGQVDDHTATCTGFAITAVVDAGDGNDTVEGPGRIQGGPGDDVLSGSQLEGGPGDDQLQGTDQSDVLAGGPGRDIISAGAGNDTIVDGGPGGERDVVDGGEGTDLLAYDGRNTPVTVSLQQPAVNEDQLTGIENLRGGDGPDHLMGDAGANTLDGGAGNDVLAGGDGADVIAGGAGSDTIDGGAGDDKLGPGDDSASNRITCGSGADRADPSPATLLEPDCEVVGVDNFDLGGRVRLRLPLRRAGSPLLTWAHPDCLDRPCTLTGTLTGTQGTLRGRALGGFSFVAGKRGSKLPRLLALRLNPEGQRALRAGASILARVRIAIDDGGDRVAQSFLVTVARG